MESPQVKLSEVALWFNVDPKTAFRALKRAGIRIIQISPRCRRIHETDFERLKQNGIPYYADELKRQ